MTCRDCFRGGRATGDPTGEISAQYGLSTYVAGTPSTTTSASTVIFLTDAFGLKLVNNKLLADAYASATGFRVLVPDIIPGGACSPDVMPIMDEVLEPVSFFNIWGQIKRVMALARAMTYFVPFFWRAFPSSPASFKPCLEYARKVKADLPPGAKLGVAGFCWGGYQSINLCAQPAVEGGSERLIDAQFCAHPSGLNVPTDILNAITRFKSPVAIAQARDDFALPTRKVEETEAILRQTIGKGEGEDGINYQITYYDNCPHGFAVRARPGYEADAKGADAAKEQAIEWFKRWL
ncbi:alpha/beta-hydrolase [Lindgomyces ingoldianus]|uniref:Alpha/beta-hydrolase n=1 Tax=Lindgomyces ingoldianus TaxID=673940 RepID=A0ACB6QEY7_9PLEO|nr:alpha/beta-hydrolase [Lindgomyces ingoldianus]KAF2464922.1 alpha/beta-hydrolase [Lindgomyces ingoldianus]